MARTFVIGDIHGERAALDRLLDRLPLGADDTLVLLGDYLDRGPDSKPVVDRVRALQAGATPARVVALRGNHEDKWAECWTEPDAVFLLSTTNGCGAMFRSFAGGPPLPPGERLDRAELTRLFDIRSWLPHDLVEWIHSLPLWYEDEHGIYVHAGLEGEGTVWHHPRDSTPKALLWMREPDFYLGYSGKRLVFGHTIVDELPTPAGAPPRREVWMRGDLIGLDTGTGREGFLSAVELPALKVYDSR